MELKTGWHGYIFAYMPFMVFYYKLVNLPNELLD